MLSFSIFQFKLIKIEQFSLYPIGVTSTQWFGTEWFNEDNLRKETEYDD